MENIFNILEVAASAGIKEKILYLLQGLQLNEEESLRVKQCINAENFDTALMFLRRNRGEILEKLHASQKALDDLDLLIYQIRKIENERTERK